MSPETAKQRQHRDGVPEKGGKLLPFPELRSFGPLTWRTIRLTSLVVLLLLVGGGFVEFFFGPASREEQPAPARAVQVPS